jgi:hypothetical protein
MPKHANYKRVPVPKNYWIMKMPITSASSSDQNLQVLSTSENNISEYERCIEQAQQSQDEAINQAYFGLGAAAGGAAVLIAGMLSGAGLPAAVAYTAIAVTSGGALVAAEGGVRAQIRANDEKQCS